MKETTGVRARATRGARAARGARARAARGPSPDARGVPGREGDPRRAFSGGVGARGRAARRRGARRRGGASGGGRGRRAAASVVGVGVGIIGVVIGVFRRRRRRRGLAQRLRRVRGARGEVPERGLDVAVVPHQALRAARGEPVVELLRRALAGLAKARDGRARGAIGARARLDVPARAPREASLFVEDRLEDVRELGRAPEGLLRELARHAERAYRPHGVDDAAAGGGGAPAHRARRRASERQLREGERRATRPRARVANEAAGAGRERTTASPRHRAPTRDARVRPRANRGRARASPRRAVRDLPETHRSPRFARGDQQNLKSSQLCQTTTRSRHLRLWTTPPPPARSRTPSPRAVASRRVS